MPPTASEEQQEMIYDATCENAATTTLSMGLEDMLLGSQMHPGKFDMFYSLGEKLQGGSYGTVFAGMHNLSEKEYAVKVVDRR